MKRFEDYLTDFDWRILRRVGVENRLPVDHNPITRALAANEHFAAELGISKKQLTALSRLAVLCQMAVFDAAGGPEQDGERKALRRHWYNYFKTQFAQPFSRQMGEDLQDKKWGDNWAKRISDVYADLVVSTDLTYHDLWVFDGSRMMDVGNVRIAAGYNLIVCVEKDTLFPDFQAAARRLGARALYSGKGVSSLAAVEKVLREAFGWGAWNCQLDRSEPLYVIHISDYDYDGEAVIGPTFGTQCRVFVDNVIEARVGITPEQVTADGQSLEAKWYEVSTPHATAKTWATEKGLEGKYGFEVEAVRVRFFHRVLVDTFLSLVNFGDLVDAMRAECTPDVWDAAREARDAYLEDDATYQRIKQAVSDYEAAVHDVLYQAGHRLAGEVSPPDDDVTEDDYREHVGNSQAGGVWRPFSEAEQTEELARLLLDDAECAGALSALSLGG